MRERIEASGWAGSASSTYRLLEDLSGVGLQAGLWEVLRLGDHVGGLWTRGVRRSEYAP